MRRIRQPNVWIPGAFVGMFLLVFAANGAMIAVAIGTWRGLQTENAYEKGVAYNQTLETEARERALGWDVDVRADSLGGNRAEIAVRLRDSAGAPVFADRVRVGMVRPTQEGYDQVVELSPREGGRYGAEVDVPLPGLWELRIAAERAGRAVRTSQRVTLGQ